MGNYQPPLTLVIFGCRCKPFGIPVLASTVEVRARALMIAGALFSDFSACSVITWFSPKKPSDPNRLYAIYYTINHLAKEARI